MKNTLTFALALTLLAGTGTAFAQAPDDHNGAAMHGPGMAGPGMSMKGPAHPDWRQGGHIASNDWGRGVHVDYRAHHLRKPPRGYEWRQVDGNYVMAGVSTGSIRLVVKAN